MKIQEIPIKEIKILDNIRQIIKEQEMPYLMQSIKENGLLQPIGVKADKVGYTLIWGFRRLMAYKKLAQKMDCIDVPHLILCQNIHCLCLRLI